MTENPNSALAYFFDVPLDATLKTFIPTTPIKIPRAATSKVKAQSIIFHTFVQSSSSAKNILIIFSSKITPKNPQRK